MKLGLGDGLGRCDGLVLLPELGHGLAVPDAPELRSPLPGGWLPATVVPAAGALPAWGPPVPEPPEPRLAGPALPPGTVIPGGVGFASACVG